MNEPRTSERSKLVDWSVYVHEDDPSCISIRHKDRPGDTLLRTSEGHVDQEQAGFFVDAVLGAGVLRDLLVEWKTADPHQHNWVDFEERVDEALRDV